jgi:hypothetical protein
MKPRDLLSILLHRPGALCRALVDPLLPDGDGLELAGGYNGLSRLVGCGNELINPQGGFNVTSSSGGESTQQLPEPPGCGPGGSDNEAASWIQDNCQQVSQEEWQSTPDLGGGDPPGRNQALYDCCTIGR